jgi:putative ABC transport system substrate-binding protein
VEFALEAAAVGHPQALITAVGSGIPGTSERSLPAIMSFGLEHGHRSRRTWPAAATVGALLYYGPEIVSLYRRAGSFHVDRILRGAKPGDLPVEGPTMYELIVNRTTARALGIAISADFAVQVSQWVD